MNGTRPRGVLGAVLLAKEPLRRTDLVALLSTDEWDSSRTIDSALKWLSPIIFVTDTSDQVRLCHKTASDLLSSYERSRKVMEHFVPENKKQELPSYLIDNKEENMRLALACVCLARRNFSLEIHSVAEILKQLDGPLSYAHHHWF